MAPHLAKLFLCSTTCARCVHDGAGARRGRAEYLNKFSPAASAAVPSIAGALVERMAARLLVFFVRHAALLRPLGHAGKLQLAQARSACCHVVAMRAFGRLGSLPMRSTLSAAPVGGAEPGGSQALKDNPVPGAWQDAAVRQGLAPVVASLYPNPVPGARQDMAELEAAVGQSLAPVEALGGPHRVLRAFRPLLFLDAGALAGSPLLGALPPGVALSHLFSRAPPGLQSPHQRSGFTPAQVLPAHQYRLHTGAPRAPMLLPGGTAHSLRPACPAGAGTAHGQQVVRLTKAHACPRCSRAHTLWLGMRPLVFVTAVLLVTLPLALPRTG